MVKYDTYFKSMYCFVLYIVSILSNGLMCSFVNAHVNNFILKGFYSNKIAEHVSKPKTA